MGLYLKRLRLFCLCTFGLVHKREKNNGLKPMDAEQLRENAHKMVDFIADYYKTIENFPVLSQVQVTNLLYHPTLTCISQIFC